MEKRLKDYIAYISGIDVSSLEPDERKELRRQMFVNIQFFQHERLIHLMVTILFAFLMMFAIFGCIQYTTIPFFIFAILVFGLLVPYIKHYYFLENGVQKLYYLYDNLEERIR